MIIVRQSGLEWCKYTLRRIVFDQVFSPALESNGQFFISGADHIGREAVIGGGRYESANLDAISLLVGKYSLGGGVAIDVGANIGNHSRWLVSWFQHVICVEPNPTIALILEANLRLTGKSNWVVVRAALGDHVGTCEVDVINQRNLGSTRIKKGQSGSDTMPLLRGDALLLAAGCSGMRVEFVKIDVEGEEVSVVQGMLELLSKEKPLIALECFDQGAWDTIRSMLARCGYRKFLVLDRRPNGRSFRARVKKVALGTRVSLEAMRDEWPEGGYDMIVCLSA